MNILVSNDDGIFAPGLWTLVTKLKSIAQVVVAAPDREQSASGTAVTLRQPLRVQRVVPPASDAETYSIEGTPCDSVILALGKLVPKPHLVVSGINQGPNLGDDVLISGTVAAALQGYLRGLPAVAISVADASSSSLENAAKLATLLAKKVKANTLPADIFLNINLPDLSLNQIKGIKLTRLAHKTHIDTVKEGHDGKKEYYWLIRNRLATDVEKATDIWAVEQGHISITALQNALFQKPLSIADGLCSELFQELKHS